VKPLKLVICHLMHFADIVRCVPFVIYTVSGKKRGHGFFCITLTNVDTVS